MGYADCGERRGVGFVLKLQTAIKAHCEKCVRFVTNVNVLVLQVAAGDVVNRNSECRRFGAKDLPFRFERGRAE